MYEFDFCHIKPSIYMHLIFVTGFLLSVRLNKPKFRCLLFWIKFLKRLYVQNADFNRNNTGKKLMFSIIDINIIKCAKSVVNLQCW